MRIRLVLAPLAVLLGAAGCDNAASVDQSTSDEVVLAPLKGAASALKRNSSVPVGSKMKLDPLKRPTGVKD